MLERLFELIIARCANGETVRIKNFGTFKMRMMKGRILKSPLMEGGEIEFPDTQVLRFHQSTVAKEMLNKLAPTDKAKKKAKGEAAKAKKKAKGEAAGVDADLEALDAETDAVVKKSKKKSKKKGNKKSKNKSPKKKGNGE